MNGPGPTIRARTTTTNTNTTGAKHVRGHDRVVRPTTGRIPPTRNKGDPVFSIEGPIIVNAMFEAGSALPDAPVVDEAPRRPRRSRQLVARTLRSVADWLEPPRRVEPALRPHPHQP
jgi:hypothetical protein